MITEKNSITTKKNPESPQIFEMGGEYVTVIIRSGGGGSSLKEGVLGRGVQEKDFAFRNF